MTVPWRPAQKLAIEAILRRYPPDSGQCATAAQEILPVAQESDGTARILRIKPKLRAPYVVPRLKLVRPWFEHHTTEAVLHDVDSLTGSDGTAVSDYLREHWEHPAFLDVQPA